MVLSLSTESRWFDHMFLVIFETCEFTAKTLFTTHANCPSVEAARSPHHTRLARLHGFSCHHSIF